MLTMCNMLFSKKKNVFAVNSMCNFINNQYAHIENSVRSILTL